MNPLPTLPSEQPMTWEWARRFPRGMATPQVTGVAIHYRDVSLTKTILSKAAWQQVRFALAYPIDQQIRWLESELFSFSNAPSVRAFLLKHTYLLPLLVDAAQLIEGIYGYPSLRLEVVVDPDEDAPNKLCASIVTDLPVELALDRLDSFDENWWLDVMSNARGLLFFNLRFQ